MKNQWKTMKNHESQRKTMKIIGNRWSRDGWFAHNQSYQPSKETVWFESTYYGHTMTVESWKRQPGNISEPPKNHHRDHHQNHANRLDHQPRMIRMIILVIWRFFEFFGKKSISFSRCLVILGSFWPFLRPRTWKIDLLSPCFIDLDQCSSKSDGYDPFWWYFGPRNHPSHLES